MINIPTINNLNVFSKKSLTKRETLSVDRGSSKPKQQKSVQDRRRKDDRRNDENDKWPLCSRLGRERRRNASPQILKRSIDTCA